MRKIRVKAYVLERFSSIFDLTIRYKATKDYDSPKLERLESEKASERVQEVA